MADSLRSSGHTVIDVDRREATVVADLSTPEGRRDAARRVLELSDGRLDGAVLAAGVGPVPGPDSPRLITNVNYLGVVELLQAWQPALAATGSAKVVVYASNSTTTTPGVPRRAVRALLAGDADAAVRAVRLFGPTAPAMAYAASKLAVSHWVRRTAVTPVWAGAGIRLNALAPGAVATPLLEAQLATPAQAKAIRAFPVPTGAHGRPEHLAAWTVFMLSEAAEFLCGSVVFVDGGSDAWFRADDWPRPVPAVRLVRYLRRTREFRRQA